MPLLDRTKYGLVCWILVRIPSSDFSRGTVRRDNENVTGECEPMSQEVPLVVTKSLGTVVNLYCGRVNENRQLLHFHLLSLQLAQEIPISFVVICNPSILKVHKK